MPVSGVRPIARIIAASRLCEDAVVFNQMVDWVSGSNWSYLAIFGVAVIDAFFPLVPSETMVIIAGTLAGAGDLNVFLVIGSPPGRAPSSATTSPTGSASSPGERTVQAALPATRRRTRASTGPSSNSRNVAATSSSSRGSSRSAAPRSPSRPATRRGCRGTASSATTSSRAASGPPTRRCSATSAASSSRSSPGRASSSGSRSRSRWRSSSSGSGIAGQKRRSAPDIVRLHVTGATGFLGSELLRLAPGRDRRAGRDPRRRRRAARSSRGSGPTS